MKWSGYLLDGRYVFFHTLPQKWATLLYITTEYLPWGMAYQLIWFKSESKYKSPIPNVLHYNILYLLRYCKLLLYIIYTPWYLYIIYIILTLFACLPSKLWGYLYCFVYLYNIAMPLVSAQTTIMSPISKLLKEVL